jgi:hypothetical protein
MWHGMGWKRTLYFLQRFSELGQNHGEISSDPGYRFRYKSLPSRTWPGWRFLALPRKEWAVPSSYFVSYACEWLCICTCVHSAWNNKFYLFLANS